METQTEVINDLQLQIMELKLQVDALTKVIELISRKHAEERERRRGLQHALKTVEEELKAITNERNDQRK